MKARRSDGRMNIRWFWIWTRKTYQSVIEFHFKRSYRSTCFRNVILHESSKNAAAQADPSTANRTNDIETVDIHQIALTNDTEMVVDNSSSSNVDINCSMNVDTDQTEAVLNFDSNNIKHADNNHSKDLENSHTEDVDDENIKNFDKSHTELTKTNQKYMPKSLHLPSLPSLRSSRGKISKSAKKV